MPGVDSKPGGMANSPNAELVETTKLAEERDVSRRDFLTGLPSLGESELYDDIAERLGATNDGQRAGAIELALEGLYLMRKISKESGGGEVVYG